MTQPHPTLEPLESRLCLAIIAAAITSGVLVVKGDANPTNATITQDAAQIRVKDWSNGFSLLVAADGVKSVTWAGSSSADKLDAHNIRVPLVAYAGPGNDVIVGGWAGDVIHGGIGWDRLYGGPGSDWFDGGETVGGGDGRDWQAETWAVQGVSPADIRQGGSPTCSILAAMASASQNVDLTDRIRYVGNYRYDCLLWRGGWRWVRVYFDGRISAYDPAPTMEYESWTILLNRAFIRLYGNQGIAYPNTAITALTGRPTASVGYWGKGPMTYGWVAYQLSQRRIIVAATWSYARGGLVGDHAYAVTGCSNGFVQLVNPWQGDRPFWISWDQFARSCWGCWSG